MQVSWVSAVRSAALIGSSAMIIAVSGCGEYSPSGQQQRTHDEYVIEVKPPSTPQAASAEAHVASGPLTSVNPTVEAKNADAAKTAEVKRQPKILTPDTPKKEVTLTDFNHTFRTLLAEERLDELEAMASHVREKKQVFRNGTVALAQMYDMLAVPDSNDEADWNKHIERLESWQRARPDSITPLIAGGHAYICYAWKARGGGFAYTVSEEGFRAFGERIERARQMLEQAAELDASDPATFAFLVTVGKAQGWSREVNDEVVQRGMTADHRYYPLYMNMAENLLQRWGGAPGELQEWALEVADRVGGDDGLDIYYRVASRINNYGGERVLETFELEKLADAVPVMRKRYVIESPDLLCLIACRADRRELAHELFQELHEDKVNKQIWGNYQVFKAFKQWSDPSFPRGHEKLVIRAHGNEHFQIEYLPDGKTIVSAFPSVERSHPGVVDRWSIEPVKLWNAETGSLLRQLPPLPMHTYALAIGPQGNTIATGHGDDSDGVIVIWKLDESAEPRVLREHTAAVTSLAFSDDGKMLASASIDGATKLWNRETGKPTFTFERGVKINALAFIQENKQLAVVSDILTVRECATGEVQTELEGVRKCQDLGGGRFAALIDVRPSVFKWGEVVPLFSLEPPAAGYGFEPASAVSPDGKLLAWAAHVPTGDGSNRSFVGIWRLADGQMLHQYFGHFGPISDLAFSPDGNTIASSSMDGTIRLWDVANVSEAAAEVAASTTN